jgi:hypothetical protein
MTVSSVRVIDERPEFDSLCGERGTLIAIVFVLIVDEDDDDDDDIDCKFRSRPST